MSTPFFLLINPWIYDFAAYDLWIKPMGLLSIAGMLKKHGFGIYMIDCLDPQTPGMREHTAAVPPLRKETGCGHFYKEHIPKPEPLHCIRRKYKRYGMSVEVFDGELASVQKPDAVIVTSMMTYWYPGVFQVIRMVKQRYPGVPVLLGGVYATLCYEHAVSCSGADAVFTGQVNSRFADTVSALTGKKIDSDPFPDPCYELVSDKTALPVLTSAGCPFSCTYCASRKMFPCFIQKDPVETARRIAVLADRYGTTDIVFYDDALLINAQTHFVPFLKEIIRRGLKLRFHTPNGMHIRGITPRTAALMAEAGFATVRLGLESTDPAFHRKTGRKVTMTDFIKTAAIVTSAGFTKDQIGVYILAGMPRQRWEDVELAVASVRETGLKPVITEYSPIPHTDLWQDAVSASRYPIETEPLFQNNTLFPCEWEGFTLPDLNRLKIRARS